MCLRVGACISLSLSFSLCPSFSYFQLQWGGVYDCNNFGKFYVISVWFFFLFWELYGFWIFAKLDHSALLSSFRCCQLYKFSFFFAYYVIFPASPLFPAFLDFHLSAHLSYSSQLFPNPEWMFYIIGILKHRTSPNPTKYHIEVLQILDSTVR